MKKILLQCATKVDKNGIRRESINGVEHIVVTSFTLPGNVVMNGGLYPSSERDASFMTLERTLAPIEHPQDEDGNFISANDPIAIHNFHAGAFNTNVSLDEESDRIKIEKFINVQEAKKSDRGKRLLDRIEEIETNDQARPIHTSVGVWLNPEELNEIRTNEAGQEYTWIAHDMVFDHDAILLDSVGAAQPNQGVGIGVNNSGQEFQVNTFFEDESESEEEIQFAKNDQKWIASSAMARINEFCANSGTPKETFFLFNYKSNFKFPFVDIIDGKPQIVPNALKDILKNINNTKNFSDDQKSEVKSKALSYIAKFNEDASHSEIERAIMKALEESAIGELWYLEEVFEDEVIFVKESGLFSVPYRLDDGRVTIVGIPLPVERKVTYPPKTNSQKGDAMKEMILNALKTAGVKTDGLSDDDLFKAYNTLQATQSNSDDDDSDSDEAAGIAEVVANALKPLTEELASMKKALNSQSEKEVDSLADMIVSSGKYPDLDKESAMLLSVDQLKKMAANCNSSFGLNPTISVNDSSLDDGVPTDMPA